MERQHLAGNERLRAFKSTLITKLRLGATFASKMLAFHKKL